jgi:hypothetical protein
MLYDEYLEVVEVGSSSLTHEVPLLIDSTMLIIKNTPSYPKAID